MNSSPKVGLKRSSSKESIGSGIHGGADSIEGSPDKSAGDVTGKNSNKMMNKAELNRILDT